MHIIPCHAVTGNDGLNNSGIVGNANSHRLGSSAKGPYGLASPALWEWVRVGQHIFRFLLARSVSILGAGPTAAGGPIFIFGRRACSSPLQPCPQCALCSAELGRYIVGINQIYDVDIDKVNKPFLPVAAGVVISISSQCTQLLLASSHIVR